MFLSSIANHYIQKIGSDMSWFTFVFPSHRAGVFFRDALHKASKGVILAPRITTISELLSEKTGLNVADNITQAFELYNVFLDIFDNEENVSTEFSFFYSWAPMFLGDFDDIDKYLVDAKQLYVNTFDYQSLADHYEHLSEEQRNAIMSFWSVDFKVNEEGENYKQRYIDIYVHMHELYTKYRERLNSKHLAYEGMIYRRATDKVEELFLNDDMHYVFVGFNALTEAEVCIFKKLQDANRADFFWDYTPEMAEQFKEQHQHGSERFIMKNAMMFPSPFKPSYPETFPKIKLTNFAYPQGQVSQVTSFVNEHYLNGKNSNAAIILTDENMLLPVLLAIPDLSAIGGGVNVTMGYPVKLSQIYGLVELLQRLHSPLNISESNGVTFYARIVQSILQHPCVVDVCGNLTTKIVDKIVKNNIIHLQQEEFGESDLLRTIFRPLTELSVSDYIRDIFEILFDYYVDGDNSEKNISILRECSYMVIKTANRFSDLLSQNETSTMFAMGALDRQLEFGMFVNLLNAQSVDFCGMPLEGLQVMGILETRAVNFDKLIILDMNEGVFPKKSGGMTFLPSVLRRSFGLPTHEYQDAIFAYYFFRLIRRASEVELLYVSTNDYEDRKGLSRFVMQLIYQYRLEVESRIAIQQLNIHTDKPTSIPKNENILQQLRTLYCGEATDERSKFLSPSALSLYIQCPAKFYYSKVLKINELDDITEDAGNNDIGSIFHYVMEKLYVGDENGDTGIDLTNVLVGKGRMFDEQSRQRLLQNRDIIEHLVCRGFEEILKIRNVSKESLEGRNRLYFDIILQCVLDLIKKEKPFVFINAEEQITGSVTIKVGDEELKVRIGGIIDRQHIDSEGRYCVIDYKTGEVHSEKIKTLDSLFENSKLKAVFQTMLYCKLLYDSGNGGEYYPGVIYIQGLYKDDLNFSLEMNGKMLSYNDSNKEEFDELLRNTLSKLFDPNVDFDAKYVERSCGYCPYKTLCQTNFGV